MAEAPYSDANTYQQIEREKEDLIAQQKMACSTFLGAGAAIIAILLLLGTLIEVIFTAHSAQAAVSVTKDSAEKQLRAYVSLNEIITQRETEAWFISFDITNSGQTPAQRVIASTNWQEFDCDIPNNFDFPDRGEPFQNIGVIGPAAQASVPRCEIPISTIRSIGRNSRKVLMWGWVEYSEEFSKARRRTEFCFLLHVRNEGHRDEIGHVHHSQFNAMDSGCVHEPKT